MGKFRMKILDVLSDFKERERLPDYNDYIILKLYLSSYKITVYVDEKNCLYCIKFNDDDFLIDKYQNIEELIEFKLANLTLDEVVEDIFSCTNKNYFTDGGKKYDLENKIEFLTKLNNNLRNDSKNLESGLFL